MRRPPWWALVSAAAAPVLLIGGWTLAASLQPPGYDPVRDTISALAARGATDRGVMSLALLGVGCSYAVTAVGLWPVRLPARWLLAVGGVATAGVATFPQPIHGNSVAHTVTATVAFSTLALWPVVAAGPSAVPLLRPVAGIGATVVMIGCIMWFLAEIHGGHRGLAERAAAGTEALWPLAVVLSWWAAGRHRP